MKNIAKCKLCESIIESFHSTDYVQCKCGEIYVDCGTAMHCGANDWNNFRRVDENGNEVIPKIKEKEEVKPLYTEKPDKKVLIEMLDEMIKRIEDLPERAMSSPINHYDFNSLLLLLSSIFKSF